MPNAPPPWPVRPASTDSMVTSIGKSSHTNIEISDFDSLSIRLPFGKGKFPFPSLHQSTPWILSHSTESFRGKLLASSSFG